LNAASKVYTNTKPILGINTDITGSEGHLLLPKNQSTRLSETFKKIFNGDFEWLMRARIQIRFEGQTADVEPIELHDQVLNNFENRFHEHYEEDRTASINNRSTGNEKNVPAGKNLLKI